MTKNKNIKISLQEGIPFKPTWSMSRIAAYTRLRCKYGIEDVYDYKAIAKDVEHRTSHYNFTKSQYEHEDLDEYMWEEWTAKLEESRQFVFNTLLEFGLIQGEAYFLSVKFAIIAIGEFRLKMFIEFGAQGGKEEFQRTALRNAINHLSFRFTRMQVHRKYFWSAEAADESINQFYTDVAVETACLLVEETGAILHAKLML